MTVPLGVVRCLSKDGVWTGCGQGSVHQANNIARGEAAESLKPLSFPTLSLSVLPADRRGQRCTQLLSDVLTLD